MNRRSFLIAPVLLFLSACANQAPEVPDDVSNVSDVSKAMAAQPQSQLVPTRAPLPEAPVAPSIQSDTWINTTPLAWDALRGKVLMVEFWTFGCINCQHVIPSLKEMYADYKDQGFIILGVHSPEFSYEKELANVQKAVKEMGIEYPVALDNDFANWKRYRNRYWPARYLIDRRGVIRFTHIGEGGDGATRQWIERLLAE